MKGRKLLLLSLLLALAAAGMVFRFLGELEAEQKRAATLVPVLVARAEIPARTRLAEDMFTVAEIPLSALHDEALAEREKIRGAFARERLLPGEQVLASRLVYTEMKSGLAYQVSSGHRALTLAVNNVSGVAGYVLPGNRVDIVVTLEAEESGGTATSLSAAVAQNIRVLAVGQYTQDQEREQLPVDNVTFDVPAGEVARLILADERGSIRLVLRPIDDNNTGNLPSYRFEQFWPAITP